MKHLIFLLLLTAFISSCNTKLTDSFELVWNDEFDYKGLPDASKWSYDTIGNDWGWGNRELQYYTFEEQNNAFVSDGTLKITALKNAIGKFDYSSSRLITKHKGDWLYGRFEIKAKLPDGRGLWPAIWMLPSDWEYGGWPKSGEIDIMENVGFDPDTIVASVHTSSYNHRLGTHKNYKTALSNNRSKFHVYAIEWDESSIKFFIDNKFYFTFKKEADNPNVWPFDKRFHILLNVAVGGDWGGKFGIDDTCFPATMEIDYVRVYQKKNVE